jgi:hypothetical protein
MKSNYAKKLVAGTLVASMTITASMPLFADELATEIPSAGAAVIVEDYINNSGKLILRSYFLQKQQIVQQHLMRQQRQKIRLKRHRHLIQQHQVRTSYLLT